MSRTTSLFAGLLLAWLTTGAAAQSASSQPPAAAEDEPPPLEELLRQQQRQLPRAVEVSTASRFAQSAEQAPLVTYVLSEQEIRLYGLRSLTDILQALPGLYVTTNSSFSFVGARGLGRPGDFNSRVLLLLDGVRINENTTDAALIGPEFYVDVDLIERVEFSPGPGSAVYGNNAFLGVINVITKRADKLAGLRMRVSADSQSRREAQASWGLRLENGHEALLSAGLGEQARVPLGYDPNPAYAEELRSLNTERVGRLFGAINAGGLALRGAHSERSRGMGTPFDARHPQLGFGKAESYYRNSLLSLSYERDLGPDIDLAIDLSGKRTQSESRDPYLEPQDGLHHVFRVVRQGRWFNGGLRLGFNQWAGHRLMIGLDKQQNFVQRIFFGPWDEPEPWGEFFGHTRRTGIFIQDEWRVHSDHLLSLGLRRDRDDLMESAQVNPRLAWNWHVNEDTRLRLIYGSAYRAANLSEFTINSLQDPPRDAPAAERIKSLELALEQSLGPQLRYRLSVYRSRFSDLISLDSKYGYYNATPLKATGLDVGLQRRWNSGADMDVSLSLQRNRDQSGQTPDNSPQALLKLRYSHPLNSQWTLAWQTQAMSRREVGGVGLAGHAVHHLNLLYQAQTDLTCSLGLYNLGQTRYSNITAIGAAPMRQEGRVLRLSLSRSFGP